MNQLKRINCLYRVSTKKQLFDDDIPMQRNACMNFIKGKPLWHPEKEYIEKGVSGYNTYESQRDILQDMKKDALEKKFDVLLVFMFDRLGRREDETPFIVEWLVQNGIEVWSVTEGQQRFDNHTDKLMNYIRFWQSGGESEKTGIRVREKLTQMVEEGTYRGGCVPFGYRRVPTGQFNKKGHTLHKLEIDETDGETVKMIFNMTNEGLNGGQIAKRLEELGRLYKGGKSWAASTLLYIIRNPVYIGDYVFGRTKSIRGGRIVGLPADTWVKSKNKLTQLIIVDDDTWQRANEIVEKRIAPLKNAKRHESMLLLKGLLQCGCCGKELSVTTFMSKAKRELNTPVSSQYQLYYCTKYYTKKPSCSAQKRHKGHIIDQMVIDEIYNYLDTFKQKDFSTKLLAEKKKTIKCYDTSISPIKNSMVKLETELEKLNDEMLKCIMGESNFSAKQITNLIDQKENRLRELGSQKDSLEYELQQSLDKFNELDNIQNSLPDWKKEFEKADFDMKQLLISHLIENISVYRDSIDIHFKLDLYKIN